MGQIVNLMSGDAENLSYVWLDVVRIISTPLSMCLSLYFLYDILGPSSFVGLAFFVLLVSINVALIRKQEEMERRGLSFKDERIKCLTEILNGMKVCIEVICIYCCSKL